MPKHNLFFLLAAAGLLVGGLVVRSQNIQMTRSLADKVVAADRAGTDTEQPIAQLKDFTATHTGVTANVILSGSYERDVATINAANTAAKAAAVPNQQVYADAQAACAGKGNSIVLAKCNQEYLAKHLTAATPAAATQPLPNVADYRRTFPAPLWTTDLAGSMLLGAGICLLAAIIGAIFFRRRRVV